MTDILRIFFAFACCLLLVTRTAAADVELTPGEQALTEQGKVIEVAVMYDFVPFSYVEDGQLTGFVADLLKLIEAKTGARLQPRISEWSDSLQRLKNKQIDAIANISFKPERTSYTLYTTPYYEIPTVVFTDKQFGNYESLADLSGKHVGVLKDIFYLKELSTREDIRISTYDDYGKLTRALAFGEIDAAIQNLTSGYHYATKNAYTNIKVAGEFTLDTVGREDLRFGVRSDRPAIQSLLQKGLDSISDQEWNQLINRWVGVSSSDFTERRQTIALTPEEREFVKNNPVIRVHNESNFEPYNFFEDGLPQGHSIDFMRMLAKRAGLEVKFVSGRSWNDYLKMMRRGELDVMTNIVYSDERSQYMLFTKPYLRLAQGIFRRQGTEDLDSIEKLKASRLALPEGFFTYQKLSQESGYNLIPARDPLDALMRISTNEADATIEIMSVAEHLMRKYAVPGIVGSNPHQVMASEPLSLRLAVTTDKPILRHILQKAMDSLSEQEKRQLQSKWTGSGALDSNYLHLSGTELAWMESHAAARICTSRSRLPFEKTTEKGDHIGAFADLLDVIRHNAGLSVRLVPVDNFSQALAYLKEGACDLVSRAPPSLESTGISLSHPLLQESLVIATGLDEIYVHDISQVRNQTLAVLEGSHVQHHLETVHPELNLRLYPDLSHAMDAIASGQVFGLIDTLPSLSRAIVTEHRSDIKISGELADIYPATLATRSSDKTLLQIVNKAIQSIRPEQYETINNRWLQAPVTAEPPDYRLIIQAALATTLLVLLMLVWNRKLARLNANIRDSRNQLMQAHEELKVKNRMLEQLSTTDRLTRLYNRLYLEKAFEEQLARAEQVNGYSFSLLLVDIDHFKQINDRYGHDRGDAVLTDFAAVLKGSCREQDIIARWGGEEFMLVCPDTRLGDAMAQAKSLLYSIQQHRFAHVGHCTASIGVASWQPGDSYQSLCRRADQALYQAKGQGRNRVCREDETPNAR